MAVSSVSNRIDTIIIERISPLRNITAHCKKMPGNPADGLRQKPEFAIIKHNFDREEITGHD